MICLARGRSTCVLPTGGRHERERLQGYRAYRYQRGILGKGGAAAVDGAGKSLRDLRVAEIVKLDLQLDAQGKVEAYRAKLNVSFKFEDEPTT
jgi:dodecin